MHIVLVTPQIPQNTGNISRLAAGMNADLHLVGDLFWPADPGVSQQPSAGDFHEIAHGWIVDAHAFDPLYMMLHTLNRVDLLVGEGFV